MNAPAAKLAQEDVAFQRGLYEDGNATRRSLHQYRRDWVLDQVARFSKSGDAVLEVGVGCGVFTEALSQTGRKVSAVDINPAFLENVRLLDAVETHLLDATNPLGLGQHDLAICSEVLEHVPSERSEMLLSAVAGSLRPGGTFILTTPQRYATVELMAYNRPSRRSSCIGISGTTAPQSRPATSVVPTGFVLVKALYCARPTAWRLAGGGNVPH